MKVMTTLENYRLSDQKHQWPKQEYFSEPFLVQGRVHLIQLDLADLSSIQTVASELQKLQKIDYLILNAGIMAAPYSLTKHGFESQFGKIVQTFPSNRSLLLDVSMSQSFVHQKQ